MSSVDRDAAVVCILVPCFQLITIYSIQVFDSQSMRKLFIDCGGHDGCSVVKFLLENSGFKAITFEPNPVFARYHRYLPNTLIQKAVSTFDGEANFTIDPMDGDGSSLLPSKPVDFTQTIANEDCPNIRVQCVDIGGFIENVSDSCGDIVLKLDVEGAEYAILRSLLDRGTIHHINRLLCEFHWEKIQMPFETHTALLDELKDHIEVEDWDALPYSIHLRGARERRRRLAQIARLWVKNALSVH